MRLTLLSLAVLAAPAVAGWQPDIESWNSPPPPRPAAVVIRNATLWTADDAGILDDADLVVRDGRIAALGSGLPAPRDAVEINGRGLHVTPGIIDAHSHAAITGGVNEFSDITTARVRIHDVIDADSINIYRQLAGGVTTINLLHGSANAIGGQDAVIKLRWGADAAGLRFEGAPSGIKFALGENPKQSNFPSDEPRYPQTRSGVEQIIREQFQRAREYQETRRRLPSGRAARGRAPPRPDLELEAIAEILAGRRLVHAHAYRADEMLMLMRLAEQFGFVVQTLQHVLEGYKIAPQMAAHGAGGSTFVDWWAFKHEAIDGIGHNPALMDRAGVVTGLHSDNPELARRLNLEAAKAVRYGGMDEHDALKLITAGPARHLRLDHRVGRLAEGLDADFVIWNGHPLSVYSRVEQTWVDGRRYFDRAADLARRQALEAERAELIALALENGADNNQDDESQADNPSRHRGLIGYSPWELDHDEFCIFHTY